MVVTGLNFVAVTAIVKHIGGSVPAAQAAFLRYVFGLVFLVPMLRPLLEARLTRTQIGLFGLRGVVHTLGVILWFYAMTQISIAEVTAMNYLSPVYVTIGAVLVLGEGFAARRFLAVLAALIGALVILRPGLRELGPGHAAMLFTPLFFAIGYLVAKRMADTVSPAVVVAMLSITVTIGLAPFAYVVWVPVSGADMLWLALVAVFATAGHYTMTLAFRAAAVSVTQPVSFLQLVWAAILGALVFGEPLDRWVMLGGTIIIGAISFISWRETVLKRRAITPAVSQTKV